MVTGAPPSRGSAGHDPQRRGEFLMGKRIGSSPHAHRPSAPTGRRAAKGRRLRPATALIAAAAGTAIAFSAAAPASAASTLRALAEAKGHYFGTALTQS